MGYKELVEDCNCTICLNNSAHEEEDECSATLGRKHPSASDPKSGHHTRVKAVAAASKVVAANLSVNTTHQNFLTLAAINGLAGHSMSQTKLSTFITFLTMKTTSSMIGLMVTYCSCYKKIRVFMTYSTGRIFP